MAFGRLADTISEQLDIVHGTFRNGRVELDEPVDWPDGSRVEVSAESESIGMREEDWPQTPEGIAALVARMEAFEPLEFTPEEEAEIAAARQAVREVTIAAVRKKMGLDP